MNGDESQVVNLVTYFITNAPQLQQLAGQSAEVATESPALSRELRSPFIASWDGA